MNTIKVFTILILAMIPALSFGQNGIDRYQTDTTLLFKVGHNHYDFVLEGTSQGFYWGKIGYYTDCRQVQFHIKNNTADTIVLNRIGGGDGAFIYQLKSSDSRSDQRVIAPNESFAVTILQNRIHYPGPASRSLSISYKQNGTEKFTSILSWALIIPPAQSKPTPQPKPKPKPDPIIVETVPARKATPPAPVQKRKTAEPIKTTVKTPIKIEEDLNIELSLADTSLTQSTVQIQCWVNDKHVQARTIWKKDKVVLSLKVHSKSRIHIQLSTLDKMVFYKEHLIHKSPEKTYQLTVPKTDFLISSLPYTFDLYRRIPFYHSNYYRIDGEVTLTTLNWYLKTYYNTRASANHNGFYLYIQHPPNAFRMERFLKTRIKNFTISPVREKPKDKKGRAWYINRFTCNFYPDVPQTAVEKILSKFGIRLVGMVGNKPYYVLAFDYLLDPRNIIKLEQLYAQKEVSSISQLVARVQVLD